MTGILEVGLIIVAVLGFTFSRARAQVDRW